MPFSEINMIKLPSSNSKVKDFFKNNAILFKNSLKTALIREYRYLEKNEYQGPKNRLDLDSGNAEY